MSLKIGRSYYRYGEVSKCVAWQRKHKLSFRWLQASFLLLPFIMAVLIFLVPAHTTAASYTWDGGGADNNWSTCANWSTNICPVAADTVTFNGTSTKDSVIDAGWGGSLSTFTIASGYTGTITASRSLTLSGVFTQGAGTFNSGAEVIDLNNNFLLTAGTFNATSNVMTIASSFTVSGSAVFNANGGTVTFDASTGSPSLSCNNITFNLVTINHTGAITETIGSNCTLPLGNNPTIGNASDTNADITINGTLTGTGTLRVAALGTGNLLTLSSTAALTGFSGLNAGRVTTSSFSKDFSAYSLFSVAGAYGQTGGTVSVPSGADFNSSFQLSSSGTFNAPSTTMTVAGSFAVDAGTTFNANSGTLTFDGTGASSVTCNGATFNLVTFAHTASTKTVNSGCTLPLGSNPTIGAAAGVGFTVAGTLTGSGTLTIAPSGASGALTISTGASLVGFTSLLDRGALTVNASIDFSSFSPFNIYGGVSLTAGTLTLPNGADFDSSLSISGGTFNAPAGTLYVAGNFVVSGSPTFNANGGTVQFDVTTAALTCNNVTFNLVTLKHTAGTKTVNSGCNLPLGNNPSVTYSVVLNGTLTGTGTLNVAGTGFALNNSASLVGFTGLVTNSFSMTSSTLDFSSYTTFDDNGAFTLSTGANFTAPTGVMTVAAGFTHNAGTTFNANGGTVTFDASSALILTCNSTVFNLVTFDKVGAGGDTTVGSGCSLPVGANPHINPSGGGSVNGASTSFTLLGTLTGSGTIQYSTLIRIGQSMTLGSGSSLSGFDGIIAKSLNIDTATYDFSSYTTFEAGVSILNNAVMTAPTTGMNLRSMTVTSGTFNASTGTIYINNDFTVSVGGTFNHNNGKVILGRDTQTLTGNITFHDLEKTGGILIFPASATTTITGELKLHETALQSATSGSTWSIDPQGTRDISGVSVRDSININGTAIVANNSEDLDNNTGWSFTGSSSFGRYSASNLVGQTDVDGNPVYTDATANNGDGFAGPDGLSGPTYMALDSIHHRLFTVEFDNNRVLVYNLDADNLLIDRTADYVLGQPDFATTSSARTQAKMNQPYGVAYENTRNYLYVREYTNSRILVFDVGSITSGEDAIAVLGQPDFTAINVTVDAKTLSVGSGIVIDEARNLLFTTDRNRARIQYLISAQSIMAKMPLRLLVSLILLLRTIKPTNTTSPYPMAWHMINQEITYLSPT